MIPQALSVSQKWPAQRNAMLDAYRWILENGVPPERVCFAGDSAGGNLVMLTMLHIRDHGSSTNVSLPACSVLISPWFDMTGAQTLKSKNQRNDMLFEYDLIQPIMNDKLRPEGLPVDTPEISSLFAPSVAKLPPQILFYGTTEVLGSDSDRWYERCNAAGTKITKVGLEGELHTFAVGWPVSSLQLQGKCDELICRFIFEHVHAS